VPDREEILKYDPSSEYSQYIEINPPNTTFNYNCNVQNNKTSFYTITLTRSDNYDQYKISVIQTSFSLDPVIITIYCYDDLQTALYFGINSFSLSPSLSVKFYYDYFLYDPTTAFNFNYLPSKYEVEFNNSLPSNQMNLKNFDPYFIFGLGFPYNFQVYDYINKSFKQYQVINWVRNL